MIDGELWVNSSRTRSVSAKVVAGAEAADFNQEEGWVLQTLHTHPHPGVPRLRDVVDDSDADRSFLVFDKLGPDLYSYIVSKRQLPETEARVLLRQLASAVAHCHRHNIVLRYVKMGKIFFACDCQGRVKFGDMAGAVVLRDPDEMTTNCNFSGNVKYMSPEQMSCQTYDGKAADAWALGIIFYFMLTGTYPFDESYARALIRRIQYGAAGINIPRYISNGARRLIYGLLDADPVSRLSVDGLMRSTYFSNAEAKGDVTIPRLIRARSVQDDDVEHDDQVVPLVNVLESMPSKRRKTGE